MIWRAVLTLSALAGAAIAGGTAFAQAMPDSENGRYAMSMVGSNVIRLDTKTGVVSTCDNKGAGWACYASPDERAAFDQEIGRLQGENDALRKQLAAREAAPGKTDEALPKSDSLKPSTPQSTDGSRKIEIPLPSDRDIDRVMGFLERAWQRLVEMANRVQKDASGRI